MTVKVGNKNYILDKDESFWYSCETQGTSFLENKNTILAHALTANLFNTPLKADASTLASYTDTPNIHIELMNNKNNPTHLSSNDDQNINDGKGSFYVRISNNGFTPLDTISTTSLFAPTCNRTSAQLATLIKGQ